MEHPGNSSETGKKTGTGTVTRRLVEQQRKQYVGNQLARRFARTFDA